MRAGGNNDRISRLIEFLLLYMYMYIHTVCIVITQSLHAVVSYIYMYIQIDDPSLQDYCHSFQSLPAALSILCEILTTDEEGGPARIPLNQFQNLYTFLATVDGGVSKDQVTSVINFLKTEA